MVQLYYTLSACIMVHVGGEPLLDEDVEVDNHVITVLSTELVTLLFQPSFFYLHRGCEVGLGVFASVTRFAHAM